MADMVLLCPLCCDKVFNSKQELIEHLRSIYENIVCPICNDKFPSVGQLIEHLQHNNCEPDNAVSVIQFDVTTGNEKECAVKKIVNEETDSNMIPDNNEVEKEVVDPFTSNITDQTEETGELGKMYVELLSKQLAKPHLQTQELKLVDDGGVSRYVILTDETPNMDDGSAIVTKQNNDGTISLTTVRDMKIEAESMVTEQTPESEENTEEVYSCNTCGVSFTSVLDHIQNYHNNQDVVVEEPMDGSNQEGTTEFEFEIPIEDPLIDKQTSRRMITETGDIIETPMMLQTTSVSLETKAITTKPVQTVAKTKASQKEPKQRRFAVVNKFCDSVVKNIEQPDEKNGPFHKVVIKEMQTNNGEKLKVFNCISCNVYVTSLEEFKTHPCKVLKYTCSHCSVSYENAKSLCAHMKVHKSKNSAVGTAQPSQYQCEFCSTMFMTHKSLKLHKRMHDPVKVRPIEPPVENADGGEASSDTYLCLECDKMIPIDYRTIHEDSHKPQEKFNCDICNKKFTSGEYLEMHMTVHNTEKVSVNKQDKYHPYTCLYCDRRFARPHEKVKHERIHTGEKPHSCEICGKSFRVSYCLTLHMRTHTGARPYSCPHCGKRFKAHSVYNHHLLTHSDVRAYKCPYCPKAFKTSVQLAGHKNSHTKPFACQHCNRPFASLYAVRVHTETHSRQNNLKFSCYMCGASYARAFALKDHMKQVHDSDHDKEAEFTEPLPSLKGDTEWISPETPAADTEDLSIAKQLPHEVEIGDLGIMSSNELIVP